MKRFFYRLARFFYNLFKSLTSRKYRTVKRIKERTIQAIKRNVRKQRFKRSQPIGRVLELPVQHRRVRVPSARTRFQVQYTTERKRIFKLLGRNGHGFQYLLIDA